MRTWTWRIRGIRKIWWWLLFFLWVSLSLFICHFLFLILSSVCIDVHIRIFLNLLFRRLLRRYWSRRCNYNFRIFRLYFFPVIIEINILFYLRPLSLLYSWGHRTQFLKSRRLWYRWYNCRSSSHEVFFSIIKISWRCSNELTINFRI